MEFRKLLVLRGPNFWANYPVLEAWVDLGKFEELPSNLLPGFNDRLMAWLPTMIEHRCSIGERGGFFERLRRGTWLGHVLEHVTLELQTLAGTEVGFGRTREMSERGVYKVVIEYKEEALGKECLSTAHRLLMAAIDDQPFDVAAEIARLRSLAQEVCLGPSTRGICQAATARGIPVRRLTAGSLVQLGYGARARRICAAESDRTGAVAQEIAQDKDLTRKLLKAVGVPTPDGRPVNGAEDAWEAAGEFGFPVVVKPQDGNQGRGVATNLTTREQVLAAYEAAAKESRCVLVERFIPGNDYRLLVVGQRVVAAARREPAQVIGDGLRSVAELVNVVNADPRRGDDHATALSKIRLDAVSLAVLGEQGYTPASVPPAGSVVLIRRNANLSTGGTAIDVTDRVHPEVAARAIEAARVVGLDIAGVDVVACDISRPLEEQRGGIVEVNAAPGLRMHLEPSIGISRPVGEAIVDLLFPAGDDGRIPIVAVTGVNGKTTTTRLISHIVRGTGRRVGMTCTDGIYIDDRRIDDEDCSGPQSARNVLLNPAVETAVLETARGGILRAGLGFDLCDVAVVTNIGEGDHLGLSDIDTTEMLAKVKRAIVDVVRPQGYAVLNAADPLVAAMAERCPGSAIFFARSPEEPVLARHRGLGGRVVFVRDNTVILAEGEREEPLLTLDRIPLTRGGLIGFHVENALAAIAAAWALGVARDVLRARLESFTLDLDKVPGRFNILDIDGATVVIDYGHNPSALLAVIDTIGKMPHALRRIVYSTAGDRRDCDMIRQGQLLGEAFDHVILYEDHYKRGRADGEIIALFRQGMASGSRVRQIEEIHGAVKAVEAALAAARPGDLLVVQADAIDETVNYIRRYLAAKAAQAAAAEPLEPMVATPAEAIPEEILAAGAQETPAAEVGSNLSA
jgi:cyanophycin synthetase